jgi:endonuclease/exonuclease/phosphatase family metal-dependent hydrolase
MSKIKKIYHILYLRSIMAVKYKTIFKKLIFSFAALIFLIASFIAYISLSDYDPPVFKSLEVKQNNPSQIEFDTTLSIISWNLGYNGLGKEMDFFYDGGTRVRANKELSAKYLKKNLAFIKSLKTNDFWFFQEVDQQSKRSYFVDQQKELAELLDDYNSCFARNYDVNWVPVPLLEPMGKVMAGMMTFSKFAPIEASRHAYPNIASWPNNLFLLDRGFILTRFLLPNQKYLVLINTHNSYYVNNDSLRKIELDLIHKKMMEEFNVGNYVIAGGDWNRLPAKFKDRFKGNLNKLQQSVPFFADDFVPENWIWVFDDEQYTNRDLISVYDNNSKKSVIDYFIVSPNVEVVENFVFPLNFENSDHNPVYLKFRLKGINPQ